MIVTDLPFVLDPLAGRAARTGEGNGLVHVTTVIRHLETVMGKPDPEHWENAALVGFLWEEAMSAALRNQAVRVADQGDLGFDLEVPGELQEDGVLLTPDDVACGDGAVWEFKFTWRSMLKNAPETIWKYLVQLKAYCYVLRTTQGRLVCAYACGDWRPPQPRVVGRRIEFSQQELVDNWAMILRGSADYARVA